MASFTEFEVEHAAIEWLSGLGYPVLYGPDISSGGPDTERLNYDQVLLTDSMLVAHNESFDTLVKRRTPIQARANAPQSRDC